jgi:hypothetical protein
VRAFLDGERLVFDGGVVRAAALAGEVQLNDAVDVFGLFGVEAFGVGVQQFVDGFVAGHCSVRGREKRASVYDWGEREKGL